MSEAENQVPQEPTGCFLDYTYCGSKNCKNKCGRKMSESIRKKIETMKFARVAYAYFCEEEDEQ